MKFLDLESVVRGLRLAETRRPPSPILRLQEEIASVTRAAELDLGLRGFVNRDRVEYIVGLKLELDNLCALWFEGRLSG